LRANDASGAKHRIGRFDAVALAHTTNRGLTGPARQG
jgi:hypothetical protein